MNFADHEELANRQKRRENQHRRDIIWNVFTVIFLTATVFLIGIFLILFSNPYVALNPYPPPTMPVLVNLSTSTATPVRLPATWTPTPRVTITPRFTSTSTPEPTLEPTAIPTVFVTDDNAEYPFAIEGQPVAMANIVFHPEANCDWQGVAGQVVDLQGRPVVGTLVRLSGFYGNKTVEMTALTGGAQAWYGESGYEFVLGRKPLDSTAALFVQLIDQSLRPISARVVFNTYSTCDKNLMLINFKQVR